MTGSAGGRRAKISVSVDRRLLRAVDSFVENHEGLDRSKVIDQALLTWYAARQDEAMMEQYRAPATPEEEVEYAVWARIRDSAVADMLSRHDVEG
jgi:hypothetical protein